jgi:hypothetical protein
MGKQIQRLQSVSIEEFTRDVPGMEKVKQVSKQRR